MSELCRVCGLDADYIFSAVVRLKYDVKYYKCDNCGFLFTESPYWLDEVYSDAISELDTGIVQRNLSVSHTLITMITIFFNRSGTYLDYAGGTGLLVRVMRDFGFDFYWNDIYCENMFARGFEQNKLNKNSKIDGIVMIECFEHFPLPIDEFEKIFRLSDNLIMTTSLLPTPIPKPNEWWYYMTERGGHISFYSTNTFKYISNRYGRYYIGYGNFHIFTKKRISYLSMKFFLRLNRLGLWRLLSKFYSSKTYTDFEKIKSNFKVK